MIDTNRSRLRSHTDSSMLSVCTDPACTTIIFGTGTCVDHDPPRLQPVETLLDEVRLRARASLPTEPREQQTIES